MLRANDLAAVIQKRIRAGVDGIRHRSVVIVAGISLAAILSHFAQRFATGSGTGGCLVPLYGGLVLGGTPALYGIFDRFARGSFALPLVEWTALATSVLREWYLAAVVLVAVSVSIGWLCGEGGAAFSRIVHPTTSRGRQRLHQARHRLLSNCWVSTPHASFCHKRKRSTPR